MLENEGGTLKRVAWSEICPCEILLRTFRLAISARVLILGAAGILLMYCGWAVIGSVFSGAKESQTAWLGECRENPWQAAVEPGGGGGVDLSEVLPMGGGGPFLGSWANLSRPLWVVFPSPFGLHEGMEVSGLACAVFCGLWSLAVWSLFGAAITRIAAVQLAAGERVGLVGALRHSCRKWPAYFGAPLFPLIGCALAALPVCLLGILMKVSFLAVLLAIVWPLMLLAGLIMAILLLGLAFGWPLMWGTVSTEGTDAFDALSRSYAYVFQRPLRYLFYVIVAVIIGSLGWVIVDGFADGVIALTRWAAEWGHGEESYAKLETAPAIIGFWGESVRLLANGYFFGYFWVASVAIYLLLRHDVDATEMDEVELDEDASEPTEELPPLATDVAGSPKVADETIPEVEPDDDEPGKSEEG